MDRLAGYAVQHMAYLVAVDMLGDKFRMTTVYKDADKEVELFSGEHSVINDRVDLYFIATSGTHTKQKNFHMYISPDPGDFMPAENALEQKLTIDIQATDHISYNRSTVQLKDMNKSTLLDILKRAGWLDIKM